jgi:ABC-type multidrug transport system fused ATPase/permease subunit
MMRHADYLNAATAEAEAVAACYENIFECIERVAHFFFNLVLMIVYVDIPASFPRASLFVCSLIPLTVLVHYSRATETRKLLEKRIRCERTYVSSLADILENTLTFRGLGATNVQKAFGHDTQAFSAAHLTAVKYTVVTKERIELLQGVILAIILAVTAYEVREGRLSTGGAVGLLNAFMTGTWASHPRKAYALLPEIMLTSLLFLIAGTADITSLSQIALRMKFCTEGLRMVGRILNYPTDAHKIAHQMSLRTDYLLNYMQRCSAPDFSQKSPFTDCHQEGYQEREYDEDQARDKSSPIGTMEKEASLEWLNTVSLQGTRHLSSSRKALASAHGQEATKGVGTFRCAIKLSCTFRLGGIVLLKGPTDEEADMLFKLISGINTIDAENIEATYVPPTLSYAYVAEMPVMLEGSIMKNLMLGVRSSMHGKPPSTDEAWHIAKRCGLDEEYLFAPETFNVGKGGRNLPMVARQAICIARGILTDPSVLMLHKPVAVLTPAMRENAFGIFSDFVKFGGLRGMLAQTVRHHGNRPLDYLLGQCFQGRAECLERRKDLFCGLSLGYW